MEASGRRGRQARGGPSCGHRNPTEREGGAPHHTQGATRTPFRPAVRISWRGGDPEQELNESRYLQENNITMDTALIQRRLGEAVAAGDLAVIRLFTAMRLPAIDATLPISMTYMRAGPPQSFMPRSRGLCMSFAYTVRGGRRQCEGPLHQRPSGNTRKLYMYLHFVVTMGGRSRHPGDLQFHAGEGQSMSIQDEAR